ncbi:hypothetical protein E4T44_03508 [Aureobasidium sp. EXF-8845]|nr:hypothetical protein E4T44_03508 [Aureobasidium sp. EXF-8845]KAI4856279.1 hypothetical protein E4T45_02260 [Aureobasidium sp. EXF-8846]
MSSYIEPVKTRQNTVLGISSVLPILRSPSRSVRRSYQGNTPKRTYASLGRDIRYVPESSGPMLPNFIPYGPSTHQIGRFCPTGTSAPKYSVDDLKPLQTIGLAKTQITVGRWTAICDNKNCLEDCAEGFWEKYCPMDIQTKQITSSVQFLGRRTKCNRSFQEHVSGI